MRAVSDCIGLHNYNFYLPLGNTTTWSHHSSICPIDESTSRQHPGVFRTFEEKGWQVINCVNQLWAGITSDIVIQTTLTRQLHITSGMKRGSGMSGMQRASWTMSRPVTPEYNIAMQQFTNLSCTTTKQHNDSPQEYMKSDAADLDNISSKSVVWSP